jgi:tol-pal system protein YbgF
MAVVPTVVGCSSVGAHSNARNAADAATQDGELTALRLALEEQEQEIRTLRGQLALARARVHELEGTGEPEPVSRSDATKAGALPWANVEERLPVTAGVPDLPPFEQPETPPAIEASPVPEPETVRIDGYRRGLQLVRDQRFAEALVELDAFAAAHPGHAYADNALFWCGEIHYLRREYTEALRYFERVEKLHPWGNKAPDALYRMGQIYARRGDRARARAYFDKVREQFPDTAAARLALREDAS